MSVYREYHGGSFLPGFELGTPEFSVADERFNELRGTLSWPDRPLDDIQAAAFLRSPTFGKPIKRSLDLWREPSGSKITLTTPS